MKRFSVLSIIIFSVLVGWFILSAGDESFLTKPLHLRQPGPPGRPKSPASSLNRTGMPPDFMSISGAFPFISRPTGVRSTIGPSSMLKASRYTLWLTEEGLVFDSFKSESANDPAAGKELSSGRRSVRTAKARGMSPGSSF